jgi:hypothetical protein
MLAGMDKNDFNGMISVHITGLSDETLEEKRSFYDARNVSQRG